MKYLSLLLLAVAPLFAQDRCDRSHLGWISTNGKDACVEIKDGGEVGWVPVPDFAQKSFDDRMALARQRAISRIEEGKQRMRGAVDMLSELQKFIQADKSMTREEILRLIATTKAIAEGKPSTAATKEFKLKLRTRDGQVVAVYQP